MSFKKPGGSFKKSTTTKKRKSSLKTYESRIPVNNEILNRNVDEIARMHSAKFVPFGAVMKDKESIFTKNYIFQKNVKKYESMMNQGIIGGFGSPEADMVIIKRNTLKPIGGVRLRKVCNEVNFVYPSMGRTVFEKVVTTDEERRTIWLSYLHLDEKERRKGHGTKIVNELFKSICDAGYMKMVPTLPNYQMQQLLIKNEFQFDQKNQKYYKTC